MVPVKVIEAAVESNPEILFLQEWQLLSEPRLHGACRDTVGQLYSSISSEQKALRHTLLLVGLQIQLDGVEESDGLGQKEFEVFAGRVVAAPLVPAGTPYPKSGMG